MISVLADIHKLNTREVPIHCVGVSPDPPGELMLRNLAELNHGDFSLKTFGDDPQRSAVSNADMKWTSWRTNLVNEKTKEVAESFKKQRMSIGSQIRIIDVMQREELQKQAGWEEEWQCAERLLASQESDRERVRDMSRDGVRELERRTSRTLSARVGGGFEYTTGQQDLGLEHLFEHTSAMPWTACSETAAAGPRIPSFDAGQARLPRLPLEPFPTLPPALGLAPTFPCAPTFPSQLPSRQRPRSARSGIV